MRGDPPRSEDRRRARPALAVACAALSAAAVAPLGAQVGQEYAHLSGLELYEAACANCHGNDGRGVEAALLGFEEALPDFTDCDFAVREPDSDWVAVAHEGGPVRGFSEMMPAFGSALTPDQLGAVIDYVRTLCTDPRWPPGELNLARGLLTEKAYPEDEWVLEADASLEGEGEVGNAFVYEQRFGPRSQFEVVIPWGWREQADPEAPGSDPGWVGGLGDVVLGLKHAVHHDGDAGRILALGGEVVLPTGAEEKGLGADGAKLEGFVSFGQILPADAFLQLQSGMEAPLYDGASNEAFGRALVGLTLTQGAWGRSWSPMVEVQAKRELDEGASTSWDVVPQIQVSLNMRQHVLANLGVLLPMTDTDVRSARLVAYVLLDWFDGGFFEGW